MFRPDLLAIFQESSMTYAACFSLSIRIFRGN